MRMGRLQEDQYSPRVTMIKATLHVLFYIVLKVMMWATNPKEVTKKSLGNS